MPVLSVVTFEVVGCEGNLESMMVLVGNMSVVVEHISVDVGAEDAPFEDVSFHGAPVALRENHACGECPRAVGAYDYEVGHVSRA